MTTKDLIGVVDAVMARATPVARESVDHGPRHWRDVARIAHALWSEGEGGLPEQLFLFALLHDSQRLSEHYDPDHGWRAAQLLAELVRANLIPGFADDELDDLEWALVHHDKGGLGESPLAKTCFDADRLTLWRVGIEPNPALLSTGSGKSRQFLDLGKLILLSPDETWEDIAGAFANDAPLDTQPSVLADEPRSANAAYAAFRRTVREGVELLPELERCVVQTASGMTFIMHRLFHQPFIPGTEQGVNDSFRRKRAVVERELKAENWTRYLLHIEKPYRVEAFYEIADDIGDAERWWEIAGWIWTDTENCHQNVLYWRELFEHAPPGDPMDADDREVFDRLPDEIVVYRGTNAEDKMGAGMSWTISKKKAEWFAQRLYMADRCTQPRVLTGRVLKEDVIGYLNSRGEDEIIALPENVTIDQIEVKEVIVSERESEAAA
jgi:hypothetical protein